MNRKLIKNKLVAILLMIIGLLTTIVSKDATVLLFMAMIGISLIFAKENYIS